MKQAMYHNTIYATRVTFQFRSFNIRGRLDFVEVEKVNINLHISINQYKINHSIQSLLR